MVRVYELTASGLAETGQIQVDPPRKRGFITGLTLSVDAPSGIGQERSTMVLAVWLGEFGTGAPMVTQPTG